MMKCFVISLTSLILLAVLATTAQAEPITVPTDLNPGDQYRLVFVTSTTRNATSSDIADYNDFVSDVAAGVPELVALGTTWTAIASTATVDARDNTGTNPSSTGVPMYRLDDTRIADGNEDLWDGSLCATLSVDEAGTTGIAKKVWTGTSTSGEGDLYGGELGDMFPVVGDTEYMGGYWVNTAAYMHYGASYRVYAMSGVLTVVPEPNTITLLLCGLSSILFLRRR